MSADLSDRALLRDLIAVAETVLRNPFAFGPGNAFDFVTLAGDITAAIRCPAQGARVGVYEAGLFAICERIASGTVSTGAELCRAVAIGNLALAQVREHYSEIIIRDARA